MEMQTMEPRVLSCEVGRNLMLEAPKYKMPLLRKTMRSPLLLPLFIVMPPLHDKLPCSLSKVSLASYWLLALWSTKMIQPLSHLAPVVVLQG